MKIFFRASLAIMAMTLAQPIYAQTLSISSTQGVANTAVQNELQLSGSSGDIVAIEATVTIVPAIGTVSFDNAVGPQGSGYSVTFAPITGTNQYKVVVTNGNQPLSNMDIADLEFMRQNSNSNVTVSVVSALGSDVNGNPITITNGSAGILGIQQQQPDLNGDGNIDPLDYGLIQQQVAGLIPKTLLADINSDNAVNILDVVLFYGAHIATGGTGNPPVTSPFGGVAGLPAPAAISVPTTNLLSEILAGRGTVYRKRDATPLRASLTYMYGDEQLFFQPAVGGKRFVHLPGSGIFSMPSTSTDAIVLEAGAGNESIGGFKNIVDVFIEPNAYFISARDGSIYIITDSGLLKADQGTGALTFLTGVNDQAPNNNNVSESFFPVKRAVITADQTKMFVLGQNGNILAIEGLDQAGQTRRIVHHPSFSMTETICPKDIAVFGNFLYILSENGVYRITTFSGSTVSFSNSDVWAGSPEIADDINGTRLNARFTNPDSITFDLGGNMFIADSGNRKIKRMDTSGNVTTWIGNGESTGINPAGSKDTTTPIGKIVNIDFQAGNNSIVVRVPELGRYIEIK